MKLVKDIGFHYSNGELQINLNKIFFKDVYENTNIEIAVDGYLILYNNIKESLKQETLEEIHNLYKKHGIKFVEYIKSGKFNLLIQDKKLKKLFLVTDYFGNLPLYYTIKNPFMFSSNILNLQINEEIDWYGMSQFLKYGHFLGDRTQNANIKALPPHSILEYNTRSKKYKISKYHPKKIQKETNILKLFKKACNRLYFKDLDYSLGLSGGIDSRFVLYHWPDKKELKTFTFLSDTPDSAELKDIEIAEKITKNFPIKDHLILNLKEINDKLFEQYIKKNNPFDIRKLYGAPSLIAVDEHFIKEKTENKKLKLRLTGDMAPVISGEFYLLRHQKYILTLLFGIKFNNVPKKILDKAITRIPKNSFNKYLKPELNKNLTEIPIPYSDINIEDYHIFTRTRRWERFGNHLCRDFEILYPFMDYNLYFNCKNIERRVNNKIYYKQIKEMPEEYKTNVTRYAFPLNYPRRIQYLSMVLKDIKRHYKPGSTHIEEIGGAINLKPTVYEYMIKNIKKAEIIKDIDNEVQKFTAGKHGHLFFQLFILSYWNNFRGKK